jgi:CheY-like chemotaxis protein
VLIADDEPDMRVLIGHVLRAAGIEVVAEASTAEEAVAFWREHRPDAIVLDQRMPPTTGLEVAGTILSEDPRQVILLFSAAVDTALRAAASNVGITACVAKEDVFEIPAIARAHVSPE